MKHFILLLLILILFKPQIAFAQIPQYVYYGGNYGSSYPLASISNPKARYIYPGKDFKGPSRSGRMTKLYLHAAEYPTSQTFSGFIIKMGQTTDTVFSTYGFTPLDTFFYSPNYTATVTGIDGWFELPFNQKAAFFDPKKSVLFEIAQNGISNIGIFLKYTYKPIGYRSLFGTYYASSGWISNYEPDFGFDWIPYGYNDAAITNIDSLPQISCSISNNYYFKVKLENQGRNRINNCTVKWSINGNIQTPILFNGLIDTIFGAVSNSSSILLGPITINPISPPIVKVWTHLPNGTIDTTSFNDTLTYLMRPGLSGTMTLGTNSSAFSDLINDINKLGVCGPLTVYIPAGANYLATSLALNNIGSLNNPISFVKTGIGPNPKVVGTLSIGGGDYLFCLNGCKNITLDGLDFEADQTFPYSPTGMVNNGLVIKNSSSTKGSSNNTIKNCKIRLYKISNAVGITQTASPTLNGFIPTSYSGSNHNNLYQNIRIENAHNGFNFIGDPNFPDTSNIINSSNGDTTCIGANGITNDIGGDTVFVYGIKLTNQKNVEVSGCIIRNLFQSGSGDLHGIYLNNISTATNYGNATIKNNRIFNLRKQPYSSISNLHGIRIDVSSSATALVLNNVIFNLDAGNPQSPSNSPILRGISHCLNGNGNASYLNNSVSINQGIGLLGSSTVFWKSGLGSATVKNNIFMNTTTNQTGISSHFAYYIASGNLIASNNLLYASNTNGFIGYLGTTRQSLYQWKIGTNLDTGSISCLPNLTSNPYLFPLLSDSLTWTINGRGTQIPGDSLDILGNSRSTLVQNGAPDLGAYEITPTGLPPFAIANPLFPISNSTQVFTFGEDTIAKITWPGTSSVPGQLSIRLFSGTNPPSVATNSRYFKTYWEMNSSPGTYTYNLQLYYNDAWCGTVPNEANEIIAQRIGNNSWTPYFGSTRDIFSNTIITNGLSQSGVFTITDYIAPLPVKILNFTANKEENNIQLNWSTSMESNNLKFELERSLDLGQTYSIIAKVDGKINSNRLTRYQHLDPIKPIIDAKINQVFYRLKQTDLDGSIHLFKEISIHLNNNENEISMIFPNPSNNVFYLKLLNENIGFANIFIIDLLGKKYDLGSISFDEGSKKIETNLESGVYNLILYNSENLLIESKKLFVK